MRTTCLYMCVYRCFQQVYDGFSAPGITTVRLSDRTRENHLSGSLGLLLARDRHSDTTLYRSTTDISVNGTSQSDTLRTQRYREKLLGRKTRSRSRRCRYNRLERRGCRGHLHSRSQVEQRTEAISRSYRRKMRLQCRRRIAESDNLGESSACRLSR